MNPLCQFKTNATVRFNPYAGRSARNVRADNQPSVNDTMAAQARPENVSDELECINLMAAVDNMSQDQMRAVLKASIAAGPEYMQRFVMGQQQATGQVSGSSNSNVPWCSCGVCHIIDDPRMNICCRQSPCITSKPEFRNLCLRHDVLEVANILNWSYRTNQDPSFSMSTFRNQAYRNFILWQHGRLGAGRRIPVPACVCRTVRQRFPEPNGQYTGYHSAHSDSD
nr:P2X purinoceptor 7 [Crassostrea gigas]